MVGIFTGFEAYASPTDDDYRQVLAEGLVVIDANVLLNLYRYTTEARDDLLRVLGKLGDRLWVPHQVMAEFWRNRLKVQRDRPNDDQKAIDELNSLLSKSSTQIRTWANRISLPDSKRDELLSELQGTFYKVMDSIASEGATVEIIRSTSKDPVVLRLAEVLDGKVGSAMTDEERESALQESERRKLSLIPPGFKDDGPGDYLVWAQTIKEVAGRSKDVLIVTGDVKEDWWREESGEKLGPRQELVDELRTKANVRLFMLRPASLLTIAGTLLEVSVREESVALAQRVDSLTVTRGGSRKLLEEGEYEQAVNYYSHLLSASPQNGSLYVGRAKAFYNLGKVDEAVGDLDRALELNPDRQDTAEMRRAMLARTWKPRSVTGAGPAIGRFIDAVQAGDVTSAEAALDEAILTGLTNPGFLCVDRTIICLLRGDSDGALATLVNERPTLVGPYVRIILEALKQLAMAQSGREPDLGGLSGLLRLVPDFDYKAGPLGWLRGGLDVENTMTPTLRSVFDFLADWKPPTSP